MSSVVSVPAKRTRVKVSGVNLEKSMMYDLTIVPIFFGVLPAVGFRFVEHNFVKNQTIFFLRSRMSFAREIERRGQNKRREEVQMKTKSIFRRSVRSNSFSLWRPF